MQTKEIRGTIEQGTIIVSINTTESNCKDAKAIMDYYLQGKNNYQVFVYLQIGNSDELHTIFDNTIECQYSKLEDWFKQCLKNGVKSGSLRKLFKSYDTRLNNGNTLQNYEVAESILLNNTECGYTTAVNWEILNLIFNDCMNRKIKNISLSTGIIVRSDCFEDVIRTSIIGSTISVITFIKNLGLEKTQYYECEVTYDKLVTSIKIKMMKNGEELTVNVSIKHNNRLAERKFESFIISKASRVNFINREMDVQAPMMNIQMIDALTLDRNISLATGIQSDQFSNFYWQNLGRDGQNNLF